MKLLTKTALVCTVTALLSCGEKKPSIECSSPNVTSLVKEIALLELSKQYSVIKSEFNMAMECQNEPRGDLGCIFDLPSYKRRNYHRNYLFNDLVLQGTESEPYQTIYNLLNGNIEVADIVTIKKSGEENICECEAKITVKLDNVDTEHKLVRDDDFLEAAEQRITYTASLTDDLSKTRVKMKYNPTFESYLMVYPSSSDVIERYSEDFEAAFGK